MNTVATEHPIFALSREEANLVIVSSVMLSLVSQFLGNKISKTQSKSCCQDRCNPKDLIPSDRSRYHHTASSLADSISANQSRSENPEVRKGRQAPCCRPASGACFL